MRIDVGSDHAGFELKRKVMAYLLEVDNRGVVDFGTYGPAPVDYPDYGAAVGAAVQDGPAERGILICGSGVGAAVAPRS